MGGPAITNRTHGGTAVVVCASGAAELARLVELVKASGRSELTPIAWPDQAALAGVRDTAHVLVFATGRSVAEELVQALRDRPARVALVVIGEDPCRRAAPTLWLPEVPAPALLDGVLHHLLRPTVNASDAPSWRRKADMIIGSSPAVRQLLHSLDQLAPAQTPVIITGESGVGKELVANALHYCGPRAKAPFIAINCAAIPDNLIEAELFGYQRGAFTGAVHGHAGAFEAADKGTLFLDEIGEMPLNMQAKLLRVLETSEVQRIGSSEPRKVNFRLVSATNRDLDAEVRAGRFREDLYYRIHVYPLHLAPLRERLEDIPALATHHLALIGARDGRPDLRLSRAALEKLVTYPWPGNVRELVNQLERAVLVAGGGVIDAEHIHLPRSASGSATPPFRPNLLPYRDAKAQFELDYYSQLLRAAGGNISMAAKLGQKTRKEVYDALKRLGVDVSAYRDLDD